MNIYLQLTEEFNLGRTRALVTSGQAVVLHRLAVVSKDGDWILREDDEALVHVLGVLESHGARYRFGAPLDVRWLRGGWSAHFEFRHEALRVRTDFFTRPPRVESARLERLWRERDGASPAFVDEVTLALMKQTDREKDYPVIGELARRMANVHDRLRFSRSARDLIELVAAHPNVAREVARERPLLDLVGADRRPVEVALDAERRALMEANETRLERYERAANAWRTAWPNVQRKIEGAPLRRAHAIVSEAARAVLPMDPAELP